MNNQSKQLNTPILFLTFNRPDLTQRVFDEIRKAQPKQLFWVSDGARNKEEEKIVDETREIIEQVDWDCEVKTNFSDKNLGCKIRVSSGIDWFFENVEQGIILEDDCLPSQSFFWFCEKLLNKYAENEKIMHIGGANFQNGKWRGEGSYYFSKYAHIWGWATWKKAWKDYDITLIDSDVDTWDYQWQNSIEKETGLCIIPNKNLVSNIGFDERATHTINNSSVKANIRTDSLIEIKHPDIIKINKKADKYTNRKLNKKPNKLKLKMKNILKGAWNTSPKSLYWSLIKYYKFKKRVKTKIEEIKNGYAKGIKLIVAENTPRIYKEMIEGNYEDLLIKKITEKTSLEGKIVWDVGAHFGYQSFVFSKLIGKEGKVISFEPNPHNIRTFRENLKNNPFLGKNIYLQEKGLSNKKDILFFNMSKEKNSAETSGGYLNEVNPPLSKSLYKNFTKIKIEVDTIDNLTSSKLPLPDLIKIDIEGGELNALKGALLTLKTKKPILIIEIHNISMMFYVQKLLSNIDYEMEIIEEKDSNEIHTKILLAVPKKNNENL